MKKFRLFVLTLLFAGVLASLASYNATALSYNNPTACYGVNGGSASNCQAGLFVTNNNITLISVSGGDAVNNGLYFILAFTAQSSANPISVSLANATAGNADIYDIDVFETVADGQRIANIFVTGKRIKNAIQLAGSIYAQGNSYGITANVIGYSNDYQNIQYIQDKLYSLDIHASNISTKLSTIITDIENMSLDITNIRNNTTNIRNNVQNIKDGVDQLNSTMEDVASNEGRIADVAEDEYNKTVQDEQTASSSAGGFSFNFTLPNPFEIFRVSDGCVSTPTIDSWLHLEGDWKSPHCPLLPADVRNTLTPVVTLIVSLGVLMVVIRWVSSSSVDVAGSVGSIEGKEKK